MNVLAQLKERGLIENITHNDLVEKLEEAVTFYVGYDPTGDSLHVGHLAMINLMRILQKAGHKPIGLIGGGTGMIGDPGGKSAERNLLAAEELELNAQGLQSQLENLLQFDEGAKPIIVNNRDWLQDFNFLDFLRVIGKKFSVNSMINRDSVKSRLKRASSGISYTEFSYMILQAYDFYMLNKHYNCVLQLGGADQWGNIVSGIDLTRRLSNQQLYGITMPLVTKADGGKFGKSESGTIWLSAEKTPPEEFHQFFLNQSDEDVIRYLKVFTDIDIEEIKELEKKVVAGKNNKAAQKRLADAVTNQVHKKA